MLRYSCVLMFLATSWVNAHAQGVGNAECSREPPYIHRPCPPDTVRRQEPNAGQARLERERAILQQRERELQQQMQRDRHIQQRLQTEHARQQQERRDRQNSDWQQLGDTFRGEMDRIQAQQERDEAAAREAATQEELRALRRQMEAMQSSAPGRASAGSAAPADGANQAPDQPPQAGEANPFAKEAEKEAQAAAGVKDPELNHAGSECAFFTRPLLRADGAGTNVYADGSTVCYGKTMYKCVRRHWTSIGRCDMYDNWQSHAAERLEGTSPRAP
jgi:hypothetical protein